jgi:3-hydroxyisobutyrate dehydrogenase
MALNLFSKTLAAHAQSSNSSNGPKFLFCENNDANAERFMAALRDKGGSELASVVDRVSSPREYV